MKKGTYKHSDEIKRKISEAKKGHSPWNKGLTKETEERLDYYRPTIFKKGHNKGLSAWNKELKLSDETRRKIGENNAKYWLGKKRSKETKEKISKTNKEREIKPPSRKGVKIPEEHRKKMSEIRRGERGSNWQGGITKENRKIRSGIEFRLWRESVFARDNWICQKCKVKGGILHPHHIKNFFQYPELRFAIDNGITFCKDCHEKFHKIYGYENNTPEQLEEFLTNKNE